MIFQLILNVGDVTERYAVWGVHSLVVSLSVQLQTTKLQIQMPHWTVGHFGSNFWLNKYTVMVHLSLND